MAVNQCLPSGVKSMPELQFMKGHSFQMLPFTDPKNEKSTRANSRSQAGRVERVDPLVCKGKCSGAVFTNNVVANCPCRELLGALQFKKYQNFSRFLDHQVTQSVSSFSILRPFGCVSPTDKSDAGLEAALRGFLWMFPYFSKHLGVSEIYDYLGKEEQGGLEFSSHQKKILKNQLDLKKKYAFKSSRFHVMFSLQELRFLSECLDLEPHLFRGRLLVLAVFLDEFRHLALTKGQGDLFAKVLQTLSKNNVPLILASSVSLLSIDHSESNRLNQNLNNGRNSFVDSQKKLRFRSAKKTEASLQARSFEEVLTSDVFDLLIQSLILGYKFASSTLASNLNNAKAAP